MLNNREVPQYEIVSSPTAETVSQPKGSDSFYSFSNAVKLSQIYCDACENKSNSSLNAIETLFFFLILAGVFACVVESLKSANKNRRNSSQAILNALKHQKNSVNESEDKNNSKPVRENNNKALNSHSPQDDNFDLESHLINPERSTEPNKEKAKEEKTLKARRGTKFQKKAPNHLPSTTVNHNRKIIKRVSEPALPNTILGPYVLNDGKSSVTLSKALYDFLEANKSDYPNLMERLIKLCEIGRLNVGGTDSFFINEAKPFKARFEHMDPRLFGVNVGKGRYVLNQVRRKHEKGSDVVFTL